MMINNKYMAANQINKDTRERRYFNVEKPTYESKKSCVVQTKEIAPL